MHHNLTLVNAERHTVSQMSFIPQKSLTAGSNYLTKEHIWNKMMGTTIFFSE